MKRICVYCGSSPGAHPDFPQAARDLGGALAARGLGLIYGGGSVGLMGEVARAALAAGGEVTGIIPRSLAAREIAFPKLTDLRLVGSMGERKALMIDLADGFIALPGGFGTLDELFETLAWAQLRDHDHPIGLLNTRGFYDPLLAFIESLVSLHFAQPEHRAMIRVDRDPNALLDQLVMGVEAKERPE